MLGNKNMQTVEFKATVLLSLLYEAMEKRDTKIEKQKNYAIQLLRSKMPFRYHGFLWRKKSERTEAELKDLASASINEIEAQNQEDWERVYSIWNNLSFMETHECFQELIVNVDINLIELIRCGTKI